MKAVFTLVSLLAVMALYAQAGKETKEYYLNKSKSQKTIGYVLAGAGAALIVSGIIVGDGDNNNDPNELDFGPDFDVGVWLLGGGIVSGIASIPFFVSSGKNARKAATIGVSHQKIQTIGYGTASRAYKEFAGQIQRNS